MRLVICGGVASWCLRRCHQLKWKNQGGLRLLLTSSIHHWRNLACKFRNDCPQSRPICRSNLMRNWEWSSLSVCCLRLLSVVKNSNPNNRPLWPAEKSTDRLWIVGTQPAVSIASYATVYRVTGPEFRTDHFSKRSYVPKLSERRKEMSLSGISKKWMITASQDLMRLLPFVRGFSIFGCANSGSAQNDRVAYGDEKGQNTSSVLEPETPTECRNTTWITVILSGMCGGEADAREILTLYNWRTCYTQQYD